MAYSLGPFGRITKYSDQFGIADYAVVYSKFNKPWSAFHAYGVLIVPDFYVVTGSVVTTSVGENDHAFIPYGSNNRSYPAAGNGIVDNVGSELKLPTLDQLKDVYLWHTGVASVWGMGDQVIVNCKKLVEDRQHTTEFREQEINVQMIGVTAAAIGTSPRPPNTPISQNGIVLYQGMRAWQGDGGTFTLDANGVVTYGVDVNETPGTKQDIKLVAEQYWPASSGYMPNTYGNNNIRRPRILGWNIPVKQPKQTTQFSSVPTLEQA